MFRERIFCQKISVPAKIYTKKEKAVLALGWQMTGNMHLSLTNQLSLRSVFAFPTFPFIGHVGGKAGLLSFTWICISVYPCASVYAGWWEQNTVVHL